MNSLKTLIFIALLSVSCSRVDNKSTIKEILIDPAKVEEAYDLVNDLEPYWDLVALETNDESLITEIKRVIYENGVYYVLDARASSILLFDSNGKYISKLSKKGKGPDEYYRINSFVVNGDNIWIYDIDRGELICYDEKFKLINKISTKEVIRAHQIEKIGNYIYLSTNWNGWNNRNAQLAVYNIELNTLNGLLYVPEKNPNAAIFEKVCQLTNKNDSCLFMYSYSDTIFLAKDESINPRYRFTFKERYEDIPFTIEEIMDPDKYDIIKGILDIKHINDKTFIGYIDNKSFVTAIFDENKKECRSYSHLIYSHLGNINIFQHAIHINGQNLIAVYEPPTILEDMADGFIADYNLIKNIEDRNKVKELVSTITENSNPIILRLKLKKDS